MDKQQAFAYHCPRWEELPKLSLYMDQTLIVIDEAVRPLLSKDEQAVTSTMINNYVKIRLIPPSTKKKYDRGHLAALIMITLLKRVLSMSELELLLSGEEIEPLYGLFCEELEHRLKEAFAPEETALRTAGSGAGPLLIAAIRTLVCKLRFEAIAAELHREQIPE